MTGDAPADGALATGRVVLPAGCGIVPVGAPGAGKSTVLGALATRAGDPGLRFGADDVRLLAFGTRAYQGAAGHVHVAARAVFAARLASGRTAAADSTNTTGAERRALLTAIARYHRPGVALLFRVPEAVLLARNAARPPDAVVPEAALLRMARRVEGLTVERLQDEGFDVVLELGGEPAPELVVASRLPPPPVPPASSTAAAARPGDAPDRPPGRAG